MVLQPEEAGHARSVDESGRNRQVRLAAVASVVGTSIEWYDFFLYGTAAAIVFPAVFFPKSSPYAGTLESFATYAVGFAARPVGAALFGHWGDRLGRKATLIITLLMMGLASALVGVLPGTATIGIAAPILLVVLRLLQGIAVGGEWSGSVLLSMEWGKQRRRGLMASWPQMGVPIGLLLGTGAMTAIALAFPDAFKAWAWRIPFLASLLLVAIGLWVRLKVMETPMFADLVAKRTVAKVPVAEVIRRYPKQIVLSALLRMSEQAPFYIYTAFALAYIKEHLHQTEGLGLAAVTVGGALELFLIPTFGNLSDRLGRRRVYATGAVLMAAGRVPRLPPAQHRSRRPHHPRGGPDRDSARHPVRPAVVLHRGELPDRARLRRQRPGLPDRLADRRRPRAAARDLDAAQFRLAGDLGLHHRLRDPDLGRGRPAAGPEQGRARHGAGADHRRALKGTATGSRGLLEPNDAGSSLT